MMMTYTVTVDANGHVTIPDTRPGETITIQVAVQPAGEEPLTLATATTPEEREAVLDAIRANAQALREAVGISDDEVESLMRADMLYGEDGSLG